MTEQTTKLAEAVAEMPCCRPQGLQRTHSRNLTMPVPTPSTEPSGLNWPRQVSFPGKTRSPMEIIEREKYVEGVEEKSHWLKATYELAITPDGAAPHPAESERCTVMCPLTDASSFQALRTYALKYYLRGKTLTATGELDVDDTAGDAPPARRPKPKQIADLPREETLVKSEDTPSHSSRSMDDPLGYDGS